MASPASPFAFWFCLGCMTCMFLFPCYYSMWQSRGTPSKTFAFFERAAKDQLSLALATKDRECKMPTKSTEVACRSAWSTDPQELNPQGNGHCCPSIIYFQPQRSPSPEPLCWEMRGRDLGICLTWHLDINWTQAKHLRYTWVPLAWPTPCQYLSSYPSARPYCSWWSPICWGLSPCTFFTIAHALQGPPMSARLSSHRGETLPPLCKRKGFIKASQQRN